MKNTNLIICLGYGPELATFMRAKYVWDFYASHFPDINFIFITESENIKLGEIISDGNKLLIGTGNRQHIENTYKTTGKWSSQQCHGQILRQMVLYDYLLRVHPENFHLYQSTITSVIDLRGLLSILPLLPSDRCFAGFPTRLSSPPELAGLTYCSGASTLFSRDMVKLMRDRYEPSAASAHAPNDVWEGLTLIDIPRTPLPYFSFNRPRKKSDGVDDVAIITKKLIDIGHFHFRVKTTSQEEGLERREDIDPWIMLKIMETILQTPHDPKNQKSLFEELCRFTGCDEMNNFPATSAESLFKDRPRTIPLTDLEFSAA